MAKKATQEKNGAFDELINKPPKITVLSDNPVSLEQMNSDTFNFSYHLGPIYDIIRHEDTQMPLTIGVYGNWGSGKTTAMKWLDGALKGWKKSGNSNDKVTTRNVWFYPWKYHSKEDVWKGLITEVILNVTDFKNASYATTLKAVKLLTVFAGESVLDILSDTEFKVAGFEVKSRDIRKIKKNFQIANHPEKAYLNEYEDAFKKWIKDALSKTNERMVIFIDDLDRCMPDIALQVLEALKLYLKIDKLIFVIGMDKSVVKEAVKAYYKNKHIEGIEANSYLDKMLQVELQLSPLQQEMDIYLDEQLKAVEYENKLEYKDDEGNKRFFGLFKTLLSKYGRRNPREVKRLINSSLIRGVGAEKIKSETTLTFEQGVQVFFIRKILQKSGLQDLVGDGRAGDKFFRNWSEIVRKNKTLNSDFPLTVEVPIDFGTESREGASLEEKTQQRLEKTFLDFANEAYHDLLQDTEFHKLVQLLRNEDLGQLMQIDYSATIAGVSKQQDSDLFSSDDDVIIKNAIAQELGKDPQDLKEKDYDFLTKLNLRGKKISDIVLLRQCKKLKELNLSGTGISNISALAELRNLTTLWLGENKISDISAIKGLENLVTLSLANNQISNISLLKTLINLTDLYLYNNQISDIQSLKQLIHLRNLELSGNQISDVKALEQLTNLTRLDLGANQISDISPLSQLTNLTSLLLGGNQIEDMFAVEKLITLQTLWLSHNNIKNISVVRKLTSLNNLRLENNRISDISVIEELTNLDEVWLGNNDISDISAIGRLMNLRGLGLDQNQISNVSALKNLSKLKILDLNNTEVDDLTPIKGLSNLTYLYASKTHIGDIQAISELTNLELLGITRTKVSDLAPITHLNNLSALFFSGTHVENLEPLKGLGKLNTLSFQNTNINTLDPLKELTSLQTLKIRGTWIDSLKPLKGLGSLRKLCLGGCEKITPKQIDELQAALPYCQIPSTKVNDELIFGRKYRLFFNPKVPGMSKTKIIQFGKGGVILKGRNNNESSWLIRYGMLEMIDSDNSIHSRFYYDPDKDRFSQEYDLESGSMIKQNISGQYMVPE